MGRVKIVVTNRWRKMLRSRIHKVAERNTADRIKSNKLTKTNKEQTMQIKRGNHFSEPFHVSNEVRQGSVLSPYLFAVDLDDFSN